MGLGKNKLKGKKVKGSKGAPVASFITYHARGGGDKQAVAVPDELDELTGSERNLVVFSRTSGTPTRRNAVPEGTGPGTYSV